MAKKATQDTGATEGSSNMAVLIKKYGNIMKTGAEIFNRNEELLSIPVSTSFDDGLNGGLKEGSWTILSGQPKAGKSSICLNILANGQKLGRKAFYVDAECRLANYNLSGIKGLNIESLQIISPDSEQKEDLSAEDVFTIIENLVKDPANKGSIIVLDSISALLPRAEMDADVSGSMRATLPKTATHWGKKILQRVKSNRICLIIITHYITNTSGYGKKYNADSGTFIQYQASSRMDITKSEDWLEGDEKVGIKITVDIDCSSNGSSGKIITSYIRFGVGIDSIKETMELGEAYGIIVKAGAWFTTPTIPGWETQKIQGTAKLYEAFEQNPEQLALLEQQIKEMLL